MQTPSSAASGSERKHLGFMFIGTAPCGCHTAWAWDDPEGRKSTAQLVARIVRRGDTLTRVERFEGDPLPQTTCEKHAAERRQRAEGRTL